MAVIREEGGSNAIKGFLFQFDKTILEILENPKDVIRVEQREDIERDKYHIQVKNRESSKYYPSGIRKAIVHLFNLFLEDEERDFSLYCHFKDKQPGTWSPSVDEIKTILGKSQIEYPQEKIEGFSSHLVIEFSDDYNSEFNTVIKKLKDSFSLTTNQLTIMYHAIIRSYLLDLAVKDLCERETCFEQIRSVVENVRSRVTMEGYQYLLGAEKYEKSVRKKYFMHSRVNVDNFERLFIVECDDPITQTDIMQIIISISHNYFIKGKSPQPYLLFRNLDDNVLKRIKRGLVDKEFFFNDGTWFDGDKIRTDKLFSKSTDKSYGKIKFLPNEKLLTEQKTLSYFDEIYEFYIRDSLAVMDFEGRHIEIPVCESQQVLNILKG